MLRLDKNMTPFFHQLTTPSTDSTSISGSLREFLVDRAISSDALRELIYFAYHRRCSSMTEQGSMAMASIGAQFRINPLVQHCLDYMQAHCSHAIAIKAYQLASEEPFFNQPAAQFFQTYIEDNFEQVSPFDCATSNLLPILC